jgi:hypothetical protein
MEPGSRRSVKHGYIDEFANAANDAVAITAVSLPKDTVRSSPETQALRRLWGRWLVGLRQDYVLDCMEEATSTARTNEMAVFDVYV